MPISITARHTDVTDEIKDYAKAKAQAMVDSFRGIERLNVVLDKQRHNNMAEVVLQAKKRFKAEAADADDDMRKAIDQVFEKIERQLRKHSEKVHDHRE